MRKHLSKYTWHRRNPGRQGLWAACADGVAAVALAGLRLSGCDTHLVGLP